MTTTSVIRTLRAPRILVVTPEITYLPQGMGNMANYLTAKGGGLADVSSTLVKNLLDLGVDIHVALPHYRKMFSLDISNFFTDELRKYKSKLPEDRVHLAEDRLFYYQDQVYNNDEDSNRRLSLVFQREVINNIIPRVQPDLIHCNDWMTGLISAYGRRMNIPCLFTVHNIHSIKSTLATMEDCGIDAAEFWHHLYYERMPHNYEESRCSNPVDQLNSGIFASHYINTVSPTFLQEIIDHRHSFVSDRIGNEISAKFHAGCAVGILNSPDPSFDPSIDNNLPVNFSSHNFVLGKHESKLQLQNILNLELAPEVPMLFWPHRLDPVQKGCQLLAEILYQIISENWKDKLQVVLIGNGPYQPHFLDIVRHHDLYSRVAVCGFDDSLSHLAFAASDFLLMPSKFEPCGLPQMICQKYGSLPIAHDTGGIHDTVTQLNPDKNSGNGFVFKHYDSNGLKWAIDQALKFYRTPIRFKERIIARIMQESVARFNHQVTAGQYLKLYQEMLARPMR